MSVKLMSTDQINADLASIHNMWAGGIPEQQMDRVNALRGELKRRGADIKAPPTNGAKQPQPTDGTPVDAMSEEQLGKEMAKLSERISKDPDNDDLQTQFADVRFEMRKRMRNKQAEAAAQQLEVKTEQLSTNGGNGGNGVVYNVEKVEKVDARFSEVLAQQEQARQAMEEQIRKYNLAKCAADVAAQVIKAINIGDVDGDIVEEACNLGVKIATTIFGKVGL